MKKRLLGILLALVLCVGLLPTAVFAELLGLTIGDTDVSGTYGGGTATYVAGTHTLTLKDVYIENNSVGITYTGSEPLIIVLEGSSTLNCDCGIKFTADSKPSLTIKGDGTLTVQAQASNDAAWLSGVSALTVSDGATVEATKGGAVLSSLTVSGGSTLVVGSGDNMAAIQVPAVPTVEEGSRIIVASGGETAGGYLAIGTDDDGKTGPMLLANDLSRVVNNGTVQLGKCSFGEGVSEAAGIKALGLTGTGLVYYKNSSLADGDTKWFTNSGIWCCNGDSATNAITLILGNSNMGSAWTAADETDSSDISAVDELTDAIRGYFWDASSNTLTLKNIALNAVTLPNADVTINIIGEAYIKGINDNSGSNTGNITIQNGGTSGTATLIVGKIDAQNGELVLDGINATVGTINHTGNNGLVTIKGGAKVDVGSLEWMNNSQDNTFDTEKCGLEMSGGSQLTVTDALGSGTLRASRIIMDEASTIELKNSELTNYNGQTYTQFGGVLEKNLENFLPERYDAATVGEAVTIVEETAPTVPVRNIKLERHYNVTATSGGNGTVSASPTRVPAGKPVTLTVDPNSGYQLGSLTAAYGDGETVTPTKVDNKDKEYTFTMPKGDVSVTATFKEITYAINKVVTPDGGGTVSVKVGDTEVAEAAQNAQLVITATPNDGYQLKSLKVTYAPASGETADVNPKIDPSSSATYYMMPAGNVTVTAEFEEIESEPTGSSKPVPSSPLYSIIVEESENGEAESNHDAARAGTVVTITTTPEGGKLLSRLVAVDENGKKLTLTRKSGEQFTFIMPASKVTVTAYFRGEQPFTDVTPGHYFFDAVNWALDNGITGGVTATSFEPYAACTRGQLVTFLWRALGEPAAKTTVNPFSDVKEGSAFYQAILWAAENDIVVGYADGTFRPNNAVTRQQAATILHRYAKFAGMDVSVGEDTNILSYNDALDVSEYAVAGVQWAVGAKVMQGSEGYLYPYHTCTRAQVVAMLYRLLAK